MKSVASAVSDTGPARTTEIRMGRHFVGVGSMTDAPARTQEQTIDLKG